MVNLKTPKYNSKGYWETVKTYQFDTSSNSVLQVFAHSPRGAKLKASNWERWLVRTNRGDDKVNKNSIKRIF